MDEQFDVRREQDEAEMAQGDFLPLGSAQAPDLTRYMLDPKEIITQYMHYLAGEGYNEKTGTWQRVTGITPILNKEGLGAIHREISSFVNNVHFLTNYEQQHIYDTVYTFSNDLTQMIFNNGERWGLKWEEAMQNNIVNNIAAIVFAAMQRAWNQGERKFLGSQTKILHRIDETPQKDSGKKKFLLFG